MGKNTGLGKGLRALFPEEAMVTSQEDEVLAVDLEKLVFYVKTNNLKPNPKQPRKTFDRNKLEELGASIKEHGIVQPLVVKPEAKGYTIIAGERRWRAANMIGLKEVPVIVKDLPPEEVLEIAIIENVQRENLNSMEEAMAFVALMENFNLTQGEIGIRIGKSRTAIANTLRLLKLPKVIQEQLAQGEITSGHARAILILDDPEKMITFANEIIEKGMSVREAENRIKKMQAEGLAKPLQKKKEDNKGYIIEIQDALEKKFETKVHLSSRGKKGKIEFVYSSLEELDRLLEQLGYEKTN
ncbi:ParB/RepB/Spo0J family partition protein [Acetobacterium carbinolicum]|jgi:ParB family chromosome partitioning protein|uniref:ParB/RepB/Spo0J family partition protein n=1 Tax=Acetobacterium TaxID=33951 RepID=UPI000DBEB71D|nr:MULTISPECIES: ParB/RepB/Spo0J family partition protein [unclassified Acetobacterium]AWW27352.1 chromosome partitioning protein ParB [Acetobacterium sp. KB-1]MDZ5725487.1 ParB/RepB/Spo0J family partition protein [Acetobacterium sp. K1/6]